jgi:FKBP-type peptidyl-prolyl cis-trans isomerase 2
MSNQGVNETQDRHKPENARALLTKAVKEAARENQKTVTIDLDEDPDIVQKGDVVNLHYTATLEDGKLIHTTRHKGAKDPDRPNPEEILGGEKTEVPGLGDAILGLTRGAKRRITLTPDKVYGPVDPDKIEKFSCIKRLPPRIRFTPEEYIKRTKSFPIIGKEVDLVPYCKARIIEVSESYTTLEFLARDGERIREKFGTTEIQSNENGITIRLIPELGTIFKAKGKEGRIISTDGKSFMVDFNHPLAGKPITIDLEVISFTKASSFGSVQIHWLEDHDLGLDMANKEHKPMVLVLYEESCPWCKKLLSESLEDPRIKMLGNRFIWVKINSRLENDLMAFYEQNGFPLTVLLNRQGEIVTKLDGFRNARTLLKELREFIHEIRMVSSPSGLSA